MGTDEMNVVLVIISYFTAHSQNLFLSLTSQQRNDIFRTQISFIHHISQQPEQSHAPKKFLWRGSRENIEEARCFSRILREGTRREVLLFVVVSFSRRVHLLLKLSLSPCHYFLPTRLYQKNTDYTAEQPRHDSVMMIDDKITFPCLKKIVEKVFLVAFPGFMRVIGMMPGSTSLFLCELFCTDFFLLIHSTAQSSFTCGKKICNILILMKLSKIFIRCNAFFPFCIINELVTFANCYCQYSK